MGEPVTEVDVSTAREAKSERRALGLSVLCPRRNGARSSLFANQVVSSSDCAILAKRQVNLTNSPKGPLPSRWPGWL